MTKMVERVFSLIIHKTVFDGNCEILLKYTFEV